MLGLQHDDGLVQVVAHRLQSLAGNANFHRTPRLPPRGHPGNTEPAAPPGARWTQNRDGPSPRPEPDPPAPGSPSGGCSEGSAAMRSGPLFRTELTAVETGCDVSPPVPEEVAGCIVASSSSLSLLAGSSQSSQLSGAITIGVRS